MFQTNSEEQKDRSSGIDTGLASSLPLWCEEFFGEFEWCRSSLLALCVSLPCPFQGDRDPDVFHHPSFVLCDFCMPKMTEHDGASIPQLQERTTACRRVKVLKETKFGRCTRCAAARRPWVYRSGPRSGQAHFVCSRLFSKTGERCFASQVMSADDIANMPRYFRKEHGSLCHRFHRAGRADFQSRSNR